MDYNNDDAINPDYIYDKSDDDISNIEDLDKVESLPTNDIYSDLDSMLETNISDWDYDSAKNYVTEFLVNVNAYKKEYIEKSEELKKWEKRQDLAKNSGKNELIEESERKIKQLLIEIENSQNNYKKLKMHYDVLREQLAQIGKSGSGNDPNLLLEKLENLVGKSSDEIEMDKKFKNISANDKLEAFKKKLQNKKEKNI